MEPNKRRIRPTGIRFGIRGNTDKDGTTHRAMGESADFYLEGQDTQCDPDADENGGDRSFPFWRIGVWGEQTALAQQYLPQPQV